MLASSRRSIDGLQWQLERELKKAGASMVGFADIAFLEPDITGGLPVAVSFGVAHDPEIVAALHEDDQAFLDHLTELSKPLRALREKACEMITAAGYACGSGEQPVTINDAEGIRSLRVFSHKMAATRAGLGWIGKSSLFVSKEFGPRIKLSSVLTDAPFATGTPIVAGRCGKCTDCVDACPHGAIQGAIWSPEVHRDDLVNVYRCSDKRSEAIPLLGRKDICGRCIQACKVGAKRLTVSQPVGGDPAALSTTPP